MFYFTSIFHININFLILFFQIFWSKYSNEISRLKRSFFLQGIVNLIKIYVYLSISKLYNEKNPFMPIYSSIDVKKRESVDTHVSPFFHLSVCYSPYIRQVSILKSKSESKKLKQKFAEIHSAMKILHHCQIVFFFFLFFLSSY